MHTLGTTRAGGRPGLDARRDALAVLRREVRQCRRLGAGIDGSRIRPPPSSLLMMHTGCVGRAGTGCAASAGRGSQRWRRQGRGREISRGLRGCASLLPASIRCREWSPRRCPSRSAPLPRYTADRNTVVFSFTRRSPGGCPRRLPGAGGECLREAEMLRQAQHDRAWGCSEGPEVSAGSEGRCLGCSDEPTACPGHSGSAPGRRPDRPANSSSTPEHGA